MLVCSSKQKTSTQNDLLALNSNKRYILNYLDKLSKRTSKSWSVFPSRYPISRDLSIRGANPDAFKLASQLFARSIRSSSPKNFSAIDLSADKRFFTCYVINFWKIFRYLSPVINFKLWYGSLSQTPSHQRLRNI